MTFTINTLTRCAGQNHYRINATVAGVARDMDISKDDLALDPDDIPGAALNRIRSAVKEANAITFAAAKTALEGKTFSV